MRSSLCYEIVLKRSLKLRIITSAAPLRHPLLKSPSPTTTDSETKKSIRRLNKTMEAVHDYNTCWNSSTNWYIAHGSLLNSVTFESSFMSIADSNQHQDALDSTPKSPLILCPTSPDSASCEITIRQVYVRSTARVYEIYYAPKSQSSNEYLCTVRCGIASRDEEVLRAANLDEAALAHLKGANKELDEKRQKIGGNSNSNEDDWVEVKAPDTPMLDCGSSLPSNFSVNSLSTQDLYEATAEITDANPCMSITLRLLLLQNKGCICVDELYLFADPVELSDSENEVGQTGNAGGSSLMAMLAPTLLQLSKTAGLRHIQNEDIFGSKEKEKTQENGSKAVESLKFVIQPEGKPSLVNQHEVDSLEAIASTIEPKQHQIPPLKDKEAKADLSCGHIERFLDQLVSRVSRVEDLLLKFEENMLKPISSIDARLQQVERQLEELSKKPKNSELPSCTRYSAPEFSCHDSDNDTPYNIGNEFLCCDLCASHEKDFSSSIQPDEAIDSVNDTRSFPSLVVTASEISDVDDEEDDHASGTDSPKDKPKQTMSIDDALASALARFLSSTSIEPQKYTQALAVKAPEFLHEEDGSIDKKVPPESHFGVTSEPCSLDTRDTMDSRTASASSNCPLERIGEATCFLNDDDSEQTAKEVVEDCQGQGTCHETVDCIVTPARHNMHQIAGDVGNGEVSSGTSKILVLDEADILNQFLENHVEQGAPGNTEIKAEVTKQGPLEEFLQNVLELSNASSVVDFETPILDVKFTSQDNSKYKSPLEALLSHMPVTDTVASCSKVSDDGSQAGEECNLISVGGEEPAWPATAGHFSLDLDGYALEVENREDYYACSNQEILATSLI
ncbi:uncharacterized protein LOC111313681 isoform X2 [Durio zibethinus]|uniref:Uncharacterized protein LOC111313681 isoform X2 n=1 Tax=Durio zibethinus TaxID=66656 RepID=A0A6P6AZ94_DURZI|nr:uncharacterized protein LOC111313681 isoform X2 [Durio zibethinus]